MSDTNWSKVGKRSRRKGKKFEQEIAKMLRLGTGDNWQTTRNSGRTDIKGDVYCSKYPFVVIECKNRKSFNLRSMIHENGLFQKAIAYIISEFLETQSSVLMVFLKNEAGIWIALSNTATIIQHADYVTWRQLSAYIKIIENRRVWHWLGGNTSSDKGKEFMNWLQKKLQNGGI